MKLFPFTFVMFALILVSTTCRADIYRSDENEEIISFTDTPNDKHFRLVQKEQRGSAGNKGKGQSHRQSDNTAKVLESSNGTRNLPIQGRITSPTGMRHDPFDGKLKHHKGMDIAAPSGTPVKPVAAGTVIFSGWKNGYGNTVILDHNDGMVTVYAHHASNSVSTGETVDLNTVIALSGSTGRSTGPHLHFEAWKGGSNITTEFMPGSDGASHGEAIASAPINRYLQADGTIVFTNLR